MPRPIHLPIAVLQLTIGAPPRPAAASPSHIRTTSAPLQTLIAAGIARSPTFHALVDQLEASDVVVYVNFRTFNEPDAHRFDTRNAVECGQRVYREALTRTRGTDGP
jgi:hypothetical protein